MAEWMSAGKVRATPKGVWDNAKAYSVLDVVTSQDHSICYISKRDVPAGTSLTNTEYWEIIVDVSNVEVPHPSNWLTDEEIDELSQALNAV